MVPGDNPSRSASTPVCASPSPERRYIAFRASRSGLDRPSTADSMAEKLDLAYPKVKLCVARPLTVGHGFVEVVRHRRHDRSLAVEQAAFQDQRALVVEQMAPERL